MACGKPWFRGDGQISGSEVLASLLGYTKSGEGGGHGRRITGEDHEPDAGSCYARRGKTRPPGGVARPFGVRDHAGRACAGRGGRPPRHHPARAPVCGIRMKSGDVFDPALTLSPKLLAGGRKESLLGIRLPPRSLCSPRRSSRRITGSLAGGNAMPAPRIVQSVFIGSPGSLPRTPLAAKRLPRRPLWLRCTKWLACLFASGDHWKPPTKLCQGHSRDQGGLGRSEI